MKYLLIPVILVLLSSCNTKKVDVFSVDAKLLRAYDSTYDNSQVLKTFNINLTLRNETRKSITFWIMLCSWEENFLINNSYIKYIADCPKNFPVKKTIPPYDSLVYKAIVIRDSGTLNPIVNETKFGFLCIDTIECKNDSKFESFLMDKSKQSKVFWSNPLYLRDIK